VFRDEEMAGGRDGEEFRDSFDDSQNQDADPIRHPMYRREFMADDKPEILLAAKKRKGLKTADPATALSEKGLGARAARKFQPRVDTNGCKSRCGEKLTIVGRNAEDES